MVSAKRRKDKTQREGTRRWPKAPPSESTGEELRFLHATKEARAQVVVHLTDGEEERGVIEYFDRDMIKLTRPDGPNIFIRKDDIRYISEDG